MKRSLFLVLGTILATSPVARADDPPRHPSCEVPAELMDDDVRLPALAEQVHAKHPITIVVIGGASTAGLASGEAEGDSYPRRLQTVMRQRHPDLPITVLNKGVARDTTQEMFNRFARDVFAFAPNLVIWETGTFDATRSIDVDVFAGALEAGLADLREHKLETMLIDMQYSRSTASVINFSPYLDAMEHTADVEGAYLFRRFEMMKYWSESGVFNFIDVPREHRAQLASEVYECLAERLADAIEHAMR